MEMLDKMHSGIKQGLNDYVNLDDKLAKENTNFRQKAFSEKSESNSKRDIRKLEKKNLKEKKIERQ